MNVAKVRIVIVATVVKYLSEQAVDTFRVKEKQVHIISAAS